MLREANPINTDCVPVSCESYVSKSLYIDDATILAKIVNVQRLKMEVAAQLHLVNKIAMDANATEEEFHQAVAKLREEAEVLWKFTRMKEAFK